MIANLIKWEGQALLSSLFFGMVLAWEYDCIRVFRRIVRHRRVWTMSVEDILYWMNAAVTVFCITYEVNDGIVRGFSLVGFVLGAVLYRYSFGRYFVKYVSRCINFALKPLKKIVSLIKIVLEKALKRAGKLMEGKEKSNEV